MNAAFLIMSSAALAGADPTPPPPPPGAPVVVNSGAGCSNCGAPVTDCCGSSKPGLFDRLKARLGGGFGKKKSHDCGCAPTPCCTPAPTPCCAPAPIYTPPPAPCNTCAPTTCCDQPTLFGKLKARWGTKKNRNGPCCDPCGGAFLSSPAAAAPAAGGTGTTPPQEMPKPKDGGKGNTSSIPQQFPSVKGVGLVGANSPY